jgi:hypothetical protein
MAYELVYEPRGGTWSVWSTIVDDFIYKHLESPEQVAEKIIGNSEYYFSDRYENGKRLIFKAQYRSRQDIIDYYEQLLSDVKELRIQVLGEQGWEEEVTPPDEVKMNLERSYKAALEDWDRGITRPNPEAKKVIRQEWIDEAEKVQREGRVSIAGIIFNITPEGLERGERSIHRAAPLLGPDEPPSTKKYKPSPWQ